MRNSKVIFYLLIISVIGNIILSYNVLSLNIFLKEQYYYSILNANNARKHNYLSNSIVNDTKYYLGMAYGIGMILDKRSFHKKESFIKDQPRYSLVVKELNYYMFKKDILKEKRDEIIMVYLKFLENYKNQNINEIYENIHQNI